MATNTTTDDWDSTTYSQKVAPFTPALTTTIQTLLSPHPTERIIDLACGDGILTQKLAAHLSSILAIDGSAAMIKGANESYSAPNIEYAVYDGCGLSEFLEKRGELGSFDKVFSNAGLHWIMRGSAERRERGFKGIFDALKVGGKFINESGGFLNVSDIRCALYATLMARGVPLETIEEASPWWFPTTAELQREVEKAGFVVELCEDEFRPTKFTKDEEGGVEGWVRLFGQNFLRLVEEREREGVVRDVGRVVRAVGDDKAGEVVCGYVRVRIVARKPE